MFRKKYGNIFALKKEWKRVFGVLALISALFTLGLWTGCIRDAQKEENNNPLYRSNDLGFELAFPEGWEGKYLVEESHNSVNVYSKVIKDSTEFPGQLFSVVRLIGELITEEDIAQSPAPEKIIHKGNGYTFVLKMPSDLQHPPHNEEMASEYKSMGKDVTDIAESISLIGNNVPEAENDEFKVIGSSFFTAEIPAYWHIEPVEGAAMSWHIKDIGWIRFIPYYTDTGSEEFRIEDRFLIAYLSDERLLKKVEIVFRDVNETLWAKIAASFEFKEGPFTSVDMETTAQQYVNAGGEKIFGEIVGAYFEVNSTIQPRRGAKYSGRI